MRMSFENEGALVTVNVSDHAIDRMMQRPKITSGEEMKRVIENAFIHGSETIDRENGRLTKSWGGLTFVFGHDLVCMYRLITVMNS